MRKPVGHCAFLAFLLLLLITAQESSAGRVIRVGYHDFDPLVFNGARGVPSGLWALP